MAKEPGRIPGPLPSVEEGLKYFWSDRELEPKQQHRFIAHFPVYMPNPDLKAADVRPDESAILAGDTEPGHMGRIINNAKDSSGLAHLLLGLDTISGVAIGDPTNEAIVKFFDNKINPAKQHNSDMPGQSGRKFKFQKLTAEAIAQVASIKDASAALLTFIDSANTIGTTPSFDAKVAALFGAEKYDNFLNEWAQANSVLIQKLLLTRISPYIVTSFTPPNYGVSVAETNIVGTAEKAQDDATNVSTIGTATVVLVSTLQDDLQFSLNLLHHLALLTARNETGVVTPALYHPALVDRRTITEKTFVVAEMSAGYKTNPPPHLGADPMEYPPFGGAGWPVYPTDKNGNTHGGTIIGLHKFHDPYITSVQTTPFTYEGAELLRTTITLSKKSGVGSFYSYQIYDDEVGSTRFPADDVITYGGNKKGLVNSLNWGQVNWPNFENKDLDKNRTLAAIEKELNEGRDKSLKDRRRVVSEVLATNDPRKMNELMTRGAGALLADERTAQEARERRAREQREMDEEFAGGIEEEWRDAEAKRGEEADARRAKEEEYMSDEYKPMRDAIRNAQDEHMNDVTRDERIAEEARLAADEAAREAAREADERIRQAARTELARRRHEARERREEQERQRIRDQVRDELEEEFPHLREARERAEEEEEAREEAARQRERLESLRD